MNKRNLEPTATADREIVLTRVFDAPRELVFDAWTDPEMLVRWYAPRGCTTQFRKIDVRQGGAFHSCIRSPEGHECWCKGEYREIVKPERIVYTLAIADEHGNSVGPEEVGMDRDWPRETILTVTLAEIEGKTKLTLHQTVSESLAKRTGAYPSWLEMLDRLSEELASKSYADEMIPASISTDPVRVVVSRSFSASADRVFDAWLDPRMIGQWMFGPALRDEEIIHLKVDPSVGGKFSFLVRRQGAEIDHVGTYLESDRPKRLVFTWGIAGESVDESRVVIEIRPTADGCMLTLIHEMDPQWAEYASRTEAGWTKMLSALAQLLS